MYWPTFIFIKQHKDKGNQPDCLHISQTAICEFCGNRHFNSDAVTAPVIPAPTIRTRVMWRLAGSNAYRVRRYGMQSVTEWLFNLPTILHAFPFKVARSTNFQCKHKQTVVELTVNAYQTPTTANMVIGERWLLTKTIRATGIPF